MFFNKKGKASSKFNNVDYRFWFKLCCVLANPHQTHILFTLKPIVIMKKFSSAPTGRFQSFAQFSPPYFITFLLILLQSFFLSAQESQPCTPPANCGDNPQYLCSEVTNFNWAIIPTGTGRYNIFVRSIIGPAVSVTYFLMSGNTLIATLSGANGYFPNVLPDCYRIIICSSSGAPTITYYCCKDLPCNFVEPGCCELRYSFITDIPNPIWQFGDNTTSNQQNVVHEYTNVNTYPTEGVPQTTIVLPFGTNPILSTFSFPEGIWVGSDCTDSGLSSTLANTLNPSLLVFPVSNYQNRDISIKGSLTMNQAYQFTDCDFCMHPSSRIVSMATALSFLNGTVLHEAACKDGAWFGVDAYRGTVVGTGATFTGAYNAIRVPVNTPYTPGLQLSGYLFNRNYIGINVHKTAVFGTFSDNTFGLASGMYPWPGLTTGACSWVSLINMPANPEPFAGVYAESFTGHGGGGVVSINLPGNAQNNLFINLSNGIFLQDANAEIFGCRFQNMLDGAYPDVNGNESDGLGVALLTSNYRSLEQTGIGKNSATLTFDNCRHAVYVRMPQFSGGDVLVRSFSNRMNVQFGYTLIGGFGIFRPNSLIQHNEITYGVNGYGVLVLNSSPDTRLTIAQNHISSTNATGIGISLFNFSPQLLGGDYRVSVVGNVDDLISNDGIYGGETGIQIANFGNALVENNTISGFLQFGIINVVSPEDDIRCNTLASAVGLESVRIDMSANSLLEYNQTDASDKGLAFTNPSNNSTISCNHIGSHDVGLYYDANAMTGQQLPNGTSAGNRWIGSYSNWAAQFTTVGSTAGSTFFYRSGEINPAQTTPSGWFQLVTTGSACDAGCPQIGLTSRTVTGLDTQVADGSLTPTGLSGYLLKRFLYNDLLYYPQLTQSNATLQNFQTSFGTANGGKLVSAEKSMADGFRLTTQQQTQWNTATSDMTTAFQQLAVLDSLAQTGTDPETQQTQRDALMQQILDAQSTLQGIYTDNLNARIASVSGLQQTLNSVSPQAQWETNERTLNDIFLNTSFVDQSPNATQTDQILQIAEQCSADGGLGVHRARAWYYALTGTRIEVNCGGVIERSVEGQTSDQVQMLISPNPAKNSVWIQLTNAIGQKSRLELFDVAGRLQKTVIVPEQVTSIEVGITDLSNGIYFCRLMEDNRLVASTKFTIQH